MRVIELPEYDTIPHDEYCMMLLGCDLDKTEQQYISDRVEAAKNKDFRSWYRIAVSNKKNFSPDVMVALGMRSYWGISDEEYDWMQEANAKVAVVLRLVLAGVDVSF